MSTQREQKPKKKKKKSLFVRPARVQKKKKAAGQEQTFIRLSRSLGRGGVKIKRYSRQVVDRFNDYASGDAGKHLNLHLQEKLDALFTRLHLDFLKGHSFLAFLAALALLLALMLMLMDNSDIALDKVTLSIAGLPDDFEGYTILVLSDLHGDYLGDRQVKLLNIVTAQSYDIAILCGDMVGKKGDDKPLLDLLAGMATSRPTFFIAGDEDPGPLLDAPRAIQSGTLEEFVLADWIVNAEEAGAIYLDTATPIQVGASTLWLTPADLLTVGAAETLSRLNSQIAVETNEVIGGVPAAYRSLPLTSYRAQVMDGLMNAVRTMEETDLHIAVAHVPPSDGYIRAAASISTEDAFPPAADLILAGHYCGGNWHVPFVGALYIPADDLPRHGWFPDQSYVEGYRQVDSTALYVTGGLSATGAVHTPSFRLVNKAKVTVITLTAALTNNLMVTGP